jgi:hypothetical protein
VKPETCDGTEATADATTGNRLSRQRVGWTGSALAVALIVVGVCVITRGSDDPGTDESMLVGPTAVSARLSAEPDSMAETLERHARAALGGNAQLGPATFVPLDSAFSPVARLDVDEATSAYVRFGNESAHAWKLYVGPGDGPTDTDVCGSARLPSVMSCHTTRMPTGGAVIASVIVLRAAPEFGPDKVVVVDDVDGLTEADLPALRIERNVRYIRPNGVTTSVKEIVTAPGSLDPQVAFSSPTSDLERLATDPALAWE